MKLEEKGKSEDEFNDDLNLFFQFDKEFDCLSKKKRDGEIYATYKTCIREEFCPDENNLVLLREIDKNQVNIYKRLVKLWNIHLERVYGIVKNGDKYIAISEFVETPKHIEKCRKKIKEYDSITLKEYVDICGTFSEREALFLFYQLCDAVEELEKNSITHGDIKPQNIVITDKPSWYEFVTDMNDESGIMLKLIDYDIVKQFKEDDHQLTVAIGTPEYAAPEILGISESTECVDIYSLGCVLNYMCLGVSSKECGLKYSKKCLSKGIYKIIKKCNNNSKELRYKNIRELKNAVKREVEPSVVKRWIMKLPGFRSNVLWKKCIAIYFYVAILMSLCLNNIYDIDNEVKKLNTASTIWILLEILFLFDVFELKKTSIKYMILREKSVLLRAFIKVIVFIIIFILSFGWYIFV